MDLKLGKLVRNEYSAREKEKMLAGHFCHELGQVRNEPGRQFVGAASKGCQGSSAVRQRQHRVRARKF